MPLSRVIQVHSSVEAHHGAPWAAHGHDGAPRRVINLRLTCSASNSDAVDGSEVAIRDPATQQGQDLSSQKWAHPQLHPQKEKVLGCSSWLPQACTRSTPPLSGQHPASEASGSDRHAPLAHMRETCACALIGSSRLACIRSRPRPSSAHARLICARAHGRRATHMRGSCARVRASLSGSRRRAWR